MRKTVLSLLCVMLALGVVPKSALTDASCHATAAEGSSFNWNHITKPPLREGLGNAEFPISTKSSEAQKYFTQGVNALHAFWDFEALRAFKAASELDPEHPMPHWGITMAISSNLSEPAQKFKRETIEKMDKLSQNASKREQLYIEALSALNSSTIQGTRDAYAIIMRRLIKEFPEDLEARAFLAFVLMDGYAQNIPNSTQPESEALLRSVLEKNPKHVGANHYWIHSMEQSPDPSKALDSALLLPTLAPNAGHIVHMAGHIHFLMGNHDKAYETYLKTQAVEKNYLDSENVSPFDSWNYLHNLSYLIFIAAEIGRYQDGLEWAKKIESIHIPESKRDSPTRSRFIYETLLAGPFLSIRLSEWDSAKASLEKLLKRPKNQTTDLAKHYYQGLIAYVQARAYLEQSELSQAEQKLEELEIETNGIRVPSPPSNDSHFVGTAKNILSIYTRELRGRINFKKNNIPQGKQWLDEAIKAEKSLGYREPPSLPSSMLEMKGEAELQSGQFEDGIITMNQAVLERKNSGPILFKLSLLQYKKGLVVESQNTLKTFFSIWHAANPELKLMKQGKALQKCHDKKKPSECSVSW